MSTVVVHNNKDIPSLNERWDRSEARYLSISWQSVLNGRTIVASSWSVPAGWTKGDEVTSTTVTDEDGTSYTGTNRVWLSTTLRRGIHKISNTVTLSGTSPGVKLTRSVNIHIADGGL